MGKWNNTKIGNFLYEREGKYKPNNPKVESLKRLVKIDFSGNIHIAEKKSKTNMIIAKQGDLIISGINVSKGALAVYEGKEDIAATIHYSSYTFDKNKIDIGFFKRFLKSPIFIQLLRGQIKGGIKTEIKPKHLLPLEIELPGILEQEEVVDFFNSIEKEVNELDVEIEHQTSLLKQLRQAILQEAVEGKLTAEWRKAHPELISGENHAALLLEKIKAEKERLVKEGKIKKQKPLPPITEDEKPFELPEGWVWCRLGDICDFITKGTTPPTTELKPEGEIPFLKVYNIVNQKIDFFYRSQFISKQVHEKLKRSKVFPGDVLMNIVGPPLGKVAFVPTLFKEWNINQALAIFRPIIKELNIFIYLYLLAGFEINKIHTLGVVGQDNISLEQCRNIIFPLTTIIEQQAIVEKVDRFMVKIDALELQVKERKTQAEQLIQTVLREAFERN